MDLVSDDAAELSTGLLWAHRPSDRTATTEEITDVASRSVPSSANRQRACTATLRDAMRLEEWPSRASTRVSTSCEGRNSGDQPAAWGQEDSLATRPTFLSIGQSCLPRIGLGTRTPTAV